MASDREMLEGVCEMFGGAASEAENIRNGRRGMQVPYHGEFAGVLHLPGVVRTIEWWAKRLRAHLDGEE